MGTYWNKLLTQTAVYWSPSSVDGWGVQTFADPVEVSVRWVEKTEMFIGGNGKEQISSAVVLLDQDVEEEGYLFLGDLDDLDSGQEADPMTANTAFQIRAVKKVPDFRGSNFLRKVWL